MSRVKIVTPKRKNPLGVATSKGAFHLVGLTVIVVPVKPLATATTAASRMRAAAKQTLGAATRAPLIKLGGVGRRTSITQFPTKRYINK